MLVGGCVSQFANSLYVARKMAKVSLSNKRTATAVALANFCHSFPITRLAPSAARRGVGHKADPS